MGRMVRVLTKITALATSVMTLASRQHIKQNIIPQQQDTETISYEMLKIIKLGLKDITLRQLANGAR